MDQNVLRQIPKMDKLLALPEIQSAGEGLPRAVVRQALQRSLEKLRSRLLAGEAMPDPADFTAEAAREIRQTRQPRLRRVVNATGVVLHTNLGRAPLGAEIARQVAEVAGGYCNLEYDLEQGKRGSRYSHVEELICTLTGGEAALVVNNNAAAVFLMLHTIAKGKTVAISRGELVEIGGSFRVPEIMEQSGARLLEVGTTNKTHPDDYRRALEEQGAEVLLKVHSSNFKIVGFSQQVSPQELSPIAGEKGVPLLYDLGAGFLIPPTLLGLKEGVSVREEVACADVVCFSGDKLLGAGQAGILVGKKRWIETMKRNQLTRMLRTDKLTLAALEGVLRWYLDPKGAMEHIPTLKMLSRKPEELKPLAERLAAALKEVCPAFTYGVEPCTDEPGGGSLPGVGLPGWAVTVTGGSWSANELENRLRLLDTPIIGRVWKGKLLLSVRTLQEGDFPAIVSGFAGLEERP